MNNNISRDVYERYLDAATALFMEYYSCDLGDTIRKETEAEDNEAFTIPKELDDRCRALIKKGCAERQHSNYWKRIGKGLRYVAAVAVVLLAAASVLFVSVEAIRIPVISYYMEHSEGYWGISEDNAPDIPKTDFNLSDPLAGLIPEEYKLVLLDGESLDRLAAIYENDAGNEIFFSAADSNSSIQIDSEGAQISKIYHHHGKDIILVVEGTEVRLAWIDEDLSITFILIATDMSSDALLDIADHLMIILSE